MVLLTIQIYRFQPSIVFRPVNSSVTTGAYKNPFRYLTPSMTLNVNFKKFLLFLYTINFFTCAQRRHFSYRTMTFNKLHLMISAKVTKILFTTLIYNLKSVDISNTSNSEWLTKLVSCQHS